MSTSISSSTEDTARDSCEMFQVSSVSRIQIQIEEPDERFLKLANGMRLPTLGLGTWNMPASAAGDAVRAAVRSGYRLIDTSPVYGNQVEIGEALRELISNGEIQRDELIIISKLWCNMMDPDEVESVVDLNLGLLRLEAFDVLLINWPVSLKQGGKTFFPANHKGDLLQANYDWMKTWKAMEELVEDGKVKAIGVSNFNSLQVDRLLQESIIKPILNQVECHPWLNQDRLVEHCFQFHVVPQGYAPLGSPRRPWVQPNDELLIRHKIVTAIAAKHNVAPSLVLLRFAIQRGIPIVTSSIHPDHIKDNMRVYDFSLEVEDMQALFIMGRRQKGRLFSFSEAASHPEYPFHHEEY